MNKYQLTIVLPGLPKGPNTREIWQIASQRARKWRTMAAQAALGKAPETGPLKACSLKCTRHSSGPEMDEDNLAMTFKPIVDGLKDAGVIAEDTRNVIKSRAYFYEKVKRKDQRVTVTVTEEVCTDS